MQWHDIEQNTEAWHDLRCGKITGSGVSKIMANLGKAFGEPAKKYASSLARERITGIKSVNSYTNDHMERGHEQEPEARIEYEERYFVDVTNGGFFDLGDKGCSPDGLVGDDGMVEIKSVIDTTFYDVLRKQSYDPSYKWQYLFNLKCAKREWIDFVNYCPDYPQGKRLYVYRIAASKYQSEFQQIEDRIGEFDALVEKCKDIILNSNYSILSN